MLSRVLGSIYMIYLELLYYYFNPFWTLDSYTVLRSNRNSKLTHHKYYQLNYVRIITGRRKFQFSRNFNK